MRIGLRGGDAFGFDTVAFERILINLVDVARKYAPGPIKFIDWRDGMLTLTVRDFGATGSGILGQTVARGFTPAWD